MVEPLSARPEITVKPEVMLLEDVLSEIAEGALRIPKFQRPFVWRPEQILDLFDSIERGFPIGSLLLWEPTTTHATLPEIGGIEIPPTGENARVAYVLDGHQRLSALFGALRRPQLVRSGAQKDWMWQVYRDLTDKDKANNHFRHWRVVDPPPPSTHLPVRALLRTVDFLGFARDMASSGSSDSAQISDLIDEAELLAQRIKSYKVAVIRLLGGTLDQAVEVFSRLNSSGSSMSPDQMVSALTYAEEGPSLADRIELIRENLYSVGFADLEPLTVFRCMLAVSGEDDILRARWSTLARRLSDGLVDTLGKTEIAINASISFLQKEAGVFRPRLLPYSLQLILLSTFFHERPTPTVAQVDELRRWFWSTSWSGYYAGANTTQVKRALQEMRSFAAGALSGLASSREQPRSFPSSFDLRSARVRALLLWHIRAYPNPLDVDGQVLNPIMQLDLADTRAYRHVVTGVGAEVSSAANRLMLPTPSGISVKTALMQLEASMTVPFLESHGIPKAALQELQNGRDVEFVRQRAYFLSMKEREFIRSMGVPEPAEQSAEPDIDTE